MKRFDARNVTKATLVDDLIVLFSDHAHISYDGEDVTLYEHMLQCAFHAKRAGKDDALIAACLLHDVGHLLHDQDPHAASQGIDTAHEEVGADFLARFFPEAVVAPVRMHVAAKRYLCTAETGYYKRLSEASRHSLALQGGPLNADEVKLFEQNPHADAAVWLRRFDEAGKMANASIGTIRDYAALLRRLSA